jgi:hypothetical protein
VAKYVKVTMPRAQAERLLELARIGAEMQANRETWQFQDGQIVQRLKLAMGAGKDLRAANRFPRPKGERSCNLDLRRKSA